MFLALCLRLSDGQSLLLQRGLLCLRGRLQGLFSGFCQFGRSLVRSLSLSLASFLFLLEFLLLLGGFGFCNLLFQRFLVRFGFGKFLGKLFGCFFSCLFLGFSFRSRLFSSFFLGFGFGFGLFFGLLLGFSLGRFFFGFLLRLRFSCFLFSF
eukprot:gnl/Spiro4/21351_TR10430_c0_g1_i1.p3 gnl/Spiro4/21351_TR10430_c0_g1~~gnl/Spiro4/21351_TR10430_c0_g1_i1.p3  ORF type:complete len:152 (-),score=53.46 gnl/Spiro4/21351_TR10430_c0_g1_i1:438-893(-)